jgi:hypothetical protein
MNICNTHKIVHRLASGRVLYKKREAAEKLRKMKTKETSKSKEIWKRISVITEYKQWQELGKSRKCIKNEIYVCTSKVMIYNLGPTFGTRFTETFKQIRGTVLWQPKENKTILIHICIDSYNDKVVRIKQCQALHWPSSIRKIKTKVSKLFVIKYFGVLL